MNINLCERNKDLESIATIETKSGDEYWTFDYIEKKLKQKSITCQVAEEDGIITGFIIYELFLHRFALLRIGVDPSSRRKKTGSGLLKAVINNLSESRSLISAEVRESNLPVQLFLKSQKFRAVEVLRNYYNDTEEDAFAFHYNLNSSKDLQPK